MKFGEKLKHYRRANHLSQDDLAQILNTTKQVISRYERGERTPKISVAKEYAEKLGVPVEVLVDDLLSMQFGSYKIDYSRKAINVYGSVPAGIPMEMIDDIVDTEELSADMFSGGKEYFGVKVKGESMTPVYLNGDTVIVLKQESCENGNDCVVSVNGLDATLKRVRFMDGGGIILQPINKDFSPQVFTRDQIESLPIRILGVVVELRRKTV